MSERAAALEPTLSEQTIAASRTESAKDAATRAAIAAEPRFARRGFAVVVVFWWVATGLLIALQRSEGTRLVGFLLGTVLAALGMRELLVSRHDETAAGARRSFLGGALLWAWISVAFYAGYLTGFPPTAEIGPVPSWGAVMPAIGATILSDIASLAVLGLAAFALRNSPNTTGVWSFALFWIVQQIAKLNVFFGVKNPAEKFLPPHLAYLKEFFGPPENSWLLWVSIAGLSAVTVWCVRRVRLDPSPGRRQAGVLYATIIGLAVLEIAILGARFETTPWDTFLRARGM